VNEKAAAMQQGGNRNRIAMAPFPRRGRPVAREEASSYAEKR
jgi:hypothetical protein